MTEAIFRENVNPVAPPRRRFADVEAVDLGAGAGFLSITIGLALVWLPLAFIIPGGLVLAVCLWRILRTPGVVR